MRTSEHLYGTEDFHSHFLSLKITIGNSLAVQWLGLGTFTAVARVQSLVGELRSHKPCHGPKNKQKKSL